jgi:hypothetical protein
MHHNPAMLGALSGFVFQANLRGGLDHRQASRFGLLDDGSTNGELGSRANLVDPSGDFFAGASFSFDPVAIAIGAYSLSNRYRADAPLSQRYHLAVNPSVPGGSYDLHHDFTLAFAWTPLRGLHLGGAFHAPVLFASRSRDDDTHLAGDGNDGVGCGAVADTGFEDPACAEHLSVRTLTSGFNLNVTGGIAYQVNDRLTLGLRYRSRPLINQGEVKLDGEATVCLPDDAADAEFYETGLPRCSDASAVAAEAAYSPPQEVAFGWSSTFGDEREWQLDGNLYWVDRCRGTSTGWGDQLCRRSDAMRTSLVGLDQNAAVLPDFRIYRGHRDFFGLELWGRKRLVGSAPSPSTSPGESTATSRRAVFLLFGAGIRTPAVRKEALTVIDAEWWTLSANLGTRVNLGRRRQKKGRGGWYIAPGYGVDFALPTTFGGSGEPTDYDSQAALDFAASGRDINGPGADAVLAGRARPTNAGRYLQDIHVFSLGVGWAELP